MDACFVPGNKKNKYILKYVSECNMGFGGKYFGQNFKFLPRLLVLNNRNPLFLPRFRMFVFISSTPGGSLLTKIFTLESYISRVLCKIVLFDKKGKAKTFS